MEPAEGFGMALGPAALAKETRNPKGQRQVHGSAYNKPGSVNCKPLLALVKISSTFTSVFDEHLGKV